MQLRQSQRREAKMRLALQGASGSGKTYSSLLIAYGMTGDWSKVAVIDSENYRHLRTGWSRSHHHRQHLPLLGLPAGFPCQLTRQLLCELGEGHAASECLYPTYPLFVLPCDLHDAKQTGLRALGQERQDGSRKGGTQSRTARQRGLRVYRRTRRGDESQGRRQQGPHGTVYGTSRISDLSPRRTGDPAMVQPNDQQPSILSEP